MHPATIENPSNPTLIFLTKNITFLKQIINMKSQAAFEYMLIVMIVLAFLVPLWAYLYNIQSQSGTEISISYAKTAVRDIINNADLVYSQGPPAKVKIKIYIPSGVEEINISGTTINFKVRVDSEVSDIFGESIAQLNGSLPTQEGNYYVNIEAKEDYVQISV